MIAIFSREGMWPICRTALIRASSVVANRDGAVFAGNFSIASL